MATKKEFKDFLKRNNLTYDQLMDIYRDIALTNSLVANLLYISKVKIEDLRIDLLEQILPQKEKDLQRIEEEKIEQERIEKERCEKEKSEVVKMSRFEDDVLEGIDNGDIFGEDDLNKIIDEFEIHRDDGENNRWTRNVTSIVEICGRFFSINWQEGLTENQMNSYYYQPVEVEKHEYEKTIKVVEWIEKTK